MWHAVRFFSTKANYSQLSGSGHDDDVHGGQGSDEAAVTRVVTVEGGRAELPCDTSAPPAQPGDSIYLVLWYNSLDSSGTPIYR